MQKITREMAEAFKPGMLFQSNGNGPHLLCIMTDICLHKDYVTIGGTPYDFNNPRELIEVYDNVPLTDADGFTLVPGRSDRYIINGESCELTEMKQWRVVDWMVNGVTPLSQVIEEAKTAAESCKRIREKTSQVSRSSVRWAKMYRLRVLLTRRDDDGTIKVAIAHPQRLTREPDRWNPLAVKRRFFERVKFANTPVEEMMEWDAAYERTKRIEERATDNSYVVCPVAFIELTPEAQAAVLAAWNLTTDKEGIA